MIDRYFSQFNGTFRLEIEGICRYISRGPENISDILFSSQGPWSSDLILKMFDEDVKENKNFRQM